MPAGGEATVSFWSWEDLEPGFDYGCVEASSDGGATWRTFLTVNGFSDGFVERQAALTGMSGDLLVRFRFVTDHYRRTALPGLVHRRHHHQRRHVVDRRRHRGRCHVAGGDGPAQRDVPPPVAGLYGLSPDLTVGPWSNVVDITVNRPQADLAVSLTDVPDPARVGQLLTYTITVVNDGPSDATGVTLRDTLPKKAGFGSVSTSQGSCGKPTKQVVTCNLGNLASGQEVVVTVTVKPTAKGDVTNTAEVAASSLLDPNPANNTDTETTTVR